MSKARDSLPQHIMEHVVSQDYSLYTAIDQAVWRFIMKISVPFFKEHAHDAYLKGLELTGIPMEKIPSVDEMDENIILNTEEISHIDTKHEPVYEEEDESEEGIEWYQKTIWIQ